ncbi:MAG: CAP domain-containing protein [bacterium]|nr:CAP domain-containing protein [bacterium]
MRIFLTILVAGIIGLSLIAFTLVNKDTASKYSPLPEANPIIVTPVPTPLPKPTPIQKPTPKPEPVKPIVQPLPPAPIPPRIPPPQIPPPQPPSNDIDVRMTIAMRVHLLINQERTKEGLAALTWNERLATIARAHSADMAVNGFSHTINGCDLACRVQKASYSYRRVGENIFTWSSSRQPEDAELAQLIVSGWMQSAGHRKNILDATFTHQGIGIYQTNGSLFATEDLALPL